MLPKHAKNKHGVKHVEHGSARLYTSTWEAEGRTLRVLGHPGL